jgi:hypothetical protein
VNRKLLAAAVVMVCYAAALCQEAVADAEQSAVRRAVETYLYAEEPAEKNGVVHPKAKIYNVDRTEGRLKETAVSAPARKPPKKAANLRAVSRQRVVGVEVSGDGAVVKVETELPPSDRPRPPHTQYISLLKIGGEWKIVSVLMPNDPTP